MKTENDKYSRLTDLLKRSVPQLDSPGRIGDFVMEAVNSRRREKSFFTDAIAFVFGWVYIGWVRRSLVAVSMLLVLLFVYQQTVIIRELSYLRNRKIITFRETSSLPAPDIEKKLMIFKMSGKKMEEDDLGALVRQMDEMNESFSELQDKYRDLVNIINSDPELKKYVEQKLTQKNKVKFNL